MAIRLRDNAQGKQLVLQALGNVPVTDDEATALEFQRLGDEYVRTGSQISMAEVRKVYPQVQVRDFTNEELAAPRGAAPVLHVVASTSAPSPAAAAAAPIDRNATASAILRACTLSLTAFSEQATWRKNGATWRAALDGVELDIGSAATMCLRKLKPDEKMLLVAQD
ncbi:MAG: hypothetical protein WKF61_05790, partial [Luteimonas sp.]